MDFKLAFKAAKDNWTDTMWWRESAIPFAKRTTLSGILKPYYRLFGPDGDDFMAEDWDNLLILDACRYDIFEKSCKIDGGLERRISVGSSTPEFLKNTFKGGSFQNTVYVTANPQVALRLDSEIFHEVIDVWKSDWDDELDTVRPEPVTKAALEAQEQYPNKRLLVHYMQPHYPFIGKTSQDELEDHSGFELTKRLASDEKANRDTLTVWDLLENGELTEPVVWEAYLENLNVVLEDLEKSIDEFKGKTVITSDHGNLIGETATPFNLQMYGHPTGIHAENLVTVPWLTVESSTRKEVTSEKSPESNHNDQDDKDTEIINERLRDLGYK